MEKPLISVVTVVRNSAELIEKTILSVLGQTFAGVEYVVVDGASTDGTTEIIKRYAPRMSAWRSEKDTGIYNAMNKGVGMARGEWVFFLNAGDVFVSDNLLAEVAPQLAVPFSAPDLQPAGESYDVVYGNILKRDGAGELFEKCSSAPGNKHKMYFCHQGVFCRRALCELFPFDEKYGLSADFKFFKTLWLRGYRFKQLDIPIAVFDTKGASNRDRIKGLRENIVIIKETDNFAARMRLLPRLYFVVGVIRLRKFFKRLRHKKATR